MARAVLSMEFVRFFVIAAAGVVVDIAIAWAIHRLLGAPLWLAAATGFSLVALGNYVAHELWTFRTPENRLSAARAAQYFAVSLATLGVRLAIVGLLDGAPLGLPALAILVIAAGVSFLASFAISKLFIFRSRPRP